MTIPHAIKGLTNPWQLVVLGLAGLVMVPLGTLFAAYFTPENEIWEHLASTLLPSLFLNTFLLAAGVSVFTLILGVSLGWLTGACEFRGRRFFSWSLCLPMAMPAYVMAFIFLGLMDFAGPVQSFIRTLPGLESFMVEVRSTPFVIIVIGLTLYPYVYLLSRASFLNQGRVMIEAARTLGLTPFKAFFRVALPISRPWIASGLALVLMETLADFGAVSIFNYDTFTTAIYKAWFGFFSLEAAAQLSGLLVIFALTLVMVEGMYRSKMRYFDGSRGGAVHSRLQLTGWKAWWATLYCGAILLIAFILPLIQLAAWSLETIRTSGGLYYLPHIGRTLFIGALSAFLLCLAALFLSYARRRLSSRLNRLLCRVATVGYALPGTVLAVAVFVPIAWADNLFQEMFHHFFNMDIGPLLKGTLSVMITAYVVRFLAVGFSSVNSAMLNIKPSIDEAAALLGANSLKALLRIHLPLLQKGLLTAMILALVDVIKEMPITLMTRPFGWDTLAVKIYELTSEGEWISAAVPGLFLVLAGIIPVFLLIRQMEK